MISIPHNEDEISLYFHIPFCSKKCDYCHFFVLPNKEEEQERYMEALLLEWKLRAPLLANKKIASIYFGGGTPALLSTSRLAAILEWISPDSTIEITLEANPENLSFNKLKTFRNLGINRLSIGAQTFQDSLLIQLGRTHSAAETVHALDSAAKASFENISIDLMYDLPHQMLSDWSETLAIAARMPITHLSLYNLTIEPETVFFKKRKALTPHLPDQDTSLAMYTMACERLENAGLLAYEISAFAKSGMYSRHNTGYWLARPFLGFGPSAFSFWEGDRFRNFAHLGKYLTALQQGQSPVDLLDRLSEGDRRNELLAVELRLRQGVDLSLFQARHGALSKECLSSIESLIRNNYIIREGNKIFLTSHGILFYDTVASEII